MTNLKSYLQELHHNLNILLKWEADYDDQVPADLLALVYDHETAVRLTKQALEGRVSLPDWQTGIEPILPSLARARITIKQRQKQVSNNNVKGEISLQEARDHLAALPLDILPAPTTELPYGSRIPFRPTHTLSALSSSPIKHKTALQFLARTLKGGETVVVTGSEGIGKTELVQEFIYHYGLFFAGGVFWLNFANPAAIETEIAWCGGQEGLNLQPNFADLPLGKQVRLVQAAWSSPRPRLLIFNQCEDPALLQHWRPTSGGCRILATSGQETWPPIADVRLFNLAKSR